MDVSLTNSTSSGSMTVIFPYDNTTLSAGKTESDLDLLHYPGGVW